MTRHTEKWMLLCILLLACNGFAAHASTVQYSSGTRTINACVLVSNATSQENGVNSGPNNPDPYLFYGLDNRTDYKPAGWRFVNPLAPPVITQPIYTRWQSRQASAGTDPAFSTGTVTPQQQVFQVGLPLTENMGAYWEENLDTISQADLDQYNVVYLPLLGGRFGAAAVQFDEQEKQKLQQYVDSGGTLWLENDGVNSFTSADGGNFFFPLATGAVPGNSLQDLAPYHPVLNSPFALGPADVNSLLEPNGNFASFLLSSPQLLTPLVSDSAGSVLLYAGRYGAGHLILDSASIGGTISRTIGGPQVDGYVNSGAVSGVNFTSIPASNLKAAFNIVSWAGYGSRSQTAAQSSIGHDLGIAWNTLPAAANGIGSGVTVSSNVAYYVDGSNVLHAYNLTPGVSLGGSSLLNDNGIVDYSMGYPYDEIFNSALPAGGQYGRPLVPSLFNPTSNQTITPVIVTNAAGTTTVLNGVTRNAAGLVNNSTSTLFSISQQAAGNTFADGHGNLLPGPSCAYADGILFVPVYDDVVGNSEQAWHIVAVNLLQSLQNGSAVNAFGSGESGEAPSTSTTLNLPGLGPLCGPLSAGYVTDKASGAEDLVVFAPVQGVAGTSSGGVNAVWFATRNEGLIYKGNASQSGYSLFTPTRANVPWFTNTSGSQALLPVIHISTVTPQGQVISVASYTYPNSNIIIDYTSGVTRVNISDSLLGPASGAPAGSTYVVSADYTLDWPGDAINGTNPTAQQMRSIYAFRGFTLYNSSSNTTNSDFMTGGATLDSNGSLLFGAFPSGLVDGNGGGSLPDRLYSVTSQFIQPGGPINVAGGTTVNWMWSPTSKEVFDGHQINERLTYTASSGALFDVANFRVVGKPTVLNGVVYALATGLLPGASASAGNVPCTIVLALNDQINQSLALNPPVEIGTNASVSTSSLQVQQPDLVNTTTSANPVYLTLKNGRDYSLNTTIDSSGAVYATSIQFNSLQVLPGQDSFNTAMPIFLLQSTNGQRSELVNSTTGFGPLDNLLWYMVIPAQPVSSDSAALQNLENLPLPVSAPSVAGSTLFYGTANGTIAAVDLQNGKDGRLLGTDGSVRVLQYNTLTQTNGTGIGTNVVQSLVNPLTVYNNVLLAGTGEGIAALNNKPTLIADGNRLLEVDAQGAAVWSIDTTNSLLPSTNAPVTGLNNTAALHVPLAHPAVVQQVSPGRYVLADTGNNRIVEIDQSGGVLMSLHSFRNDLMELPAGEATVLSQPTDVQVYTDVEANGTISLTSRTSGVTYNYTGAYYATHYIIADSGNNRSLEILDAYNPVTGQAIVLTPSNNNYPPVTLFHQAIFTTRSLGEQNAHYRYRTIQEFADPLNANAIDMIAAVSNGGFVNGPTAQGFGSFQNLPSGAGTGAVMFIKRFNGQDGATAQIQDHIQIMAADGVTVIRRQPIQNPSWFKEFAYTDPSTGVSSLHYLLADANGCYELQADAQGNLDTVWMLTSSDYYRMTGRPLHAVSIQRLPSSDVYADVNGVKHFAPHYLITNSYNGSDNVAGVFSGASNILNGQVHGEVFEIAGAPYYAQTVNESNAAGGTSAVYAGYLQPAVALYAINGGLLAANPNSAIVQMIPAETISPTTQSPIQRTIGSYGSGTSTGSLQGTSFAYRP